MKNNEVVVSTLGGNSKILPDSSHPVIYASCYIVCNGRNYLATGSTNGLQLWSSDGTEMKHFCALSTLLEHEGNGNLENQYIQCVSSCGYNNVACGSSTGSIIIVEVPNNCHDDLKIVHTLNMQKKTQDKNPPNIVAMHGSDCLLACANENGDIAGFDVLSAFQQICFIPVNPNLTANSLITCIITRGDTIIAGFNTGHIRIYRASLQELAIELTAHYRWVTALAIHPNNPIFCSCSEDQFVRVWGFPEFHNRSTSIADLIHSERIENKMCTGACFFNYNSTGMDYIGIATYDDDEIIVLSKTI